MKFNREKFFAAIKSMFRGNFKKIQIAGINALLDNIEKLPGTFDLRWIAYMLATTFHETASSMWPIREFGKGRGKKYGTRYYGRGYVQLTWLANYKAMSPVCGVDLEKNPELALDPVNAWKIMLEGMTKGTFTSKKLSTYFNKITDDPQDARRIINGTDRAALIAGYYRVLLGALRKAQETKEGVQATMVAEGSPKGTPGAPVKVEVPPVVIPSPPIVHPAPSAASPTLGEVLWGYMKAKLHGS